MTFNESTIINRNLDLVLYLVSRFGEPIPLYTLTNIIRMAIKHKYRDLLDSLVRKMFDLEIIDSKLKAQILLILIISYRNTIDGTRWMSRNMMVEFYFLLGWTRTQIDYSPQTRIDAFEFSEIV